jgi:hypothetical protein
MVHLHRFFAHAVELSAIFVNVIAQSVENPVLTQVKGKSWPRRDHLYRVATTSVSARGRLGEVRGHLADRHEDRSGSSRDERLDPAGAVPAIHCLAPQTNSPRPGYARSLARQGWSPVDAANNAAKPCEWV